MADWLDIFVPNNKKNILYTRLAGGLLLFVSIGLRLVQYLKMGPYASPNFYDAVPSIIHYLPYIGALGSLLMILKPEFFQGKVKNPEIENSDD